MVVSFIALFVSLGGAGYAAVHLPVHSVGNAQLQNFSVGNAKLRSNSVGAAKIISGAVGARQVNSSQVQLRVAGPCTAGAMQSIGQTGDVTCTPVLPNEFGATAPATTLLSGGGTVQVVTKSLPAGSSYLVLAYAHVVVTARPTDTQRVDVDCQLSAGGTQQVDEDFAVDAANDSHDLAGSIPLAMPVASSTIAQTASLNCDDQWTPSTPGPVVTVDATINAIQTASNN
jgi:hypothetical protein